jgi:hypothetical protein
MRSASPVCSPAARPPGPRVHTVPMVGLLFFNNEGFECGGLCYGGRAEDDGCNAGSILAFDRYNQQDVVTVGYHEIEGRRFYGVTIFDRPEEPIAQLAAKVDVAMQLPEGPMRDEALNARARQSGTERMIMGRTPEGEVAVQLNDSKGRPRIRMLVDKDDVPRLEFLNEAGEVVYSLPPEK